MAVPLCFASEPYTPELADPFLEPWRWREMEQLNGLGVRCMDEALDGSLWFGGSGTLVRYDGLHIEKIALSAELLATFEIDPSTHTIRDLIALQDGSLLIVYGGKLLRWKAGACEMILDQVGPTALQVALERADDGSFWLMTQRKLHYLSADLKESRTVLFGKKKYTYTAFCQDSSGGVWVVRRTNRDQRADLIYIPKKNGTFRDSEKHEVYPIEIDEAGVEAAIQSGPQGKIWYVDSESKTGILSFDPDLRRWQLLNKPDTEHSYYSMMKDHQGTLWAGGKGGLYAIRKDPGYYNASALGFSANLANIFESSDGKLWVISRDGHVHFIDRTYKRWKTYKNLHYGCESESGVQWFLKSGRGIVSYDPSTEVWLQHDKGDGVIKIAEAITASRDGLIWASGSHEKAAAISVFDGERWTLHRHPELAASIGRNAVLEAQDGTMWFGASGKLPNRPDSGGILRYRASVNEGAELQHRYTRQQVPPKINCFAQKADGRIWIGAPTIQIFDPESGEMSTVEKLPGIGTRSMVVDHDQVMWVFKTAHGLFRESSEGWRLQTAEEGLKSGIKGDVLVLNDGTLLAPTEDGAFRYDGQVWSMWSASGFYSMSDDSEGLDQMNDDTVWLNFDRQMKLSDGSFSSAKSLFTVHYVADTYAPETYLESAVRKVAPPGNAYFSWSGADRWSDTPIEGLQYSWRLNGGAWSPFSYKKDHYFLNLKDGKCLLEVRARDRDFNIDPTPAGVEFVVQPPIWKQGWFIFMIFLTGGSIAGLIFSVLYFQEKSLKERRVHLEELDRLKTSFFTNISHELNTPLALVMGPLDRVLKTDLNEKNRKMLTMAQRNAKQAFNLVSQLLDFRKLEVGQLKMEYRDGNIAHHVNESIEHLRPMAQQRGINLITETEAEIHGLMDPDKLQKIVSNLVSNAIKYTPPHGVVRLVLKDFEDASGNRQVNVIVEDSGPGIDPEHKDRIFDRFYRIPERKLVDGSGIGLNLVKDLVTLWGGKVEVESPLNPGGEHFGTRFTVCLPINPRFFNDSTGETDEI